LRRLAPGEQLAIKRGPNGDLLTVVHQRETLERHELRPEPPPRRGDGASSPTALTWSAHVRQASRVGRRARCSSERRSSSPESGYPHARKHSTLGGLWPHLALDYGVPMGTPVRAVADGVVTTAGRVGAYGPSVTIRHARGFESMYNHVTRIVVRGGERVHQRTVIGHVGATGLATGPHLDYQLRQKRPAGESVGGESGLAQSSLNRR